MEKDQLPKKDERHDVKDKATKEKDAETIENKERAKANIPDPPVCEPQLGDLTPDYIEWVRKYHPDDFEARYKGRIPELSEEKEQQNG
jgi:hypothetical protein